MNNAYIGNVRDAGVILFDTEASGASDTSV